MSVPTKEQVEDCFKAMDTDNKMHLTKTQAKVAVRAMGKNPTEAQINEVMKGMSEDIGLGDFMKVYNSGFPSPQSQDAEARSILKMLDPTGNGLMSESELRQILATLGEPMLHQDIDMVMDGISVNDKGFFRYDDFVTVMVTGHMDFGA